MLLGLFAGGAGAAARFIIGTIVQSRYRGGFPLGTTVVNLSGSFLLGVLVGADASHEVVAVGALGGYTTFSTWMGESVSGGDLGDVGRRVALPLVTGLAAAWLGLVVGEAIRSLTA